MTVSNIPALPHPYQDEIDRRYMDQLIGALEDALEALNRGEPIKNNIIDNLAAGDHLQFDGVTWRNYSAVTDAITSGTTQTQAGATALTSLYNRVTTHGNTNDGVKLPTAFAGKTCTVHNDTATADLQVWPATSDAIEAAAVDAVGVTKLAAGVIHTYTAIDATTWYITNVVTPP